MWQHGMINTNDPALYEPLQRQLVFLLFSSSSPLWGHVCEFNPHPPSPPLFLPSPHFSMQTQAFQPATISLSSNSTGGMLFLYVEDTHTDSCSLNGVLVNLEIWTHSPHHFQNSANVPGVLFCPIVSRVIHVEFLLGINSPNTACNYLWQISQ